LVATNTWLEGADHMTTRALMHYVCPEKVVVPTNLQRALVLWNKIALHENLDKSLPPKVWP